MTRAEYLDRLWRMKHDYEEGMTFARQAWVAFTPEQRADPETLGRYNLIKNTLAASYREARQALVAEAAAAGV